MPVQIGQKQESDFSNPLGLLSDCHRRIESFLSVLLKLGDRANRDPLQPEEHSALDAALSYFRNSAPKHTADEEVSLFPRLRTSGEAATVLDCLTRLEGDHKTAERDHQTVDELGNRWLNRGTLDPPDARSMRDALARLAELYAKHIAIEDQELFPAAGRILAASDLAAVGQEMAERRGLKK